MTDLPPTSLELAAQIRALDRQILHLMRALDALAERLKCLEAP